MGKDFRHMSGEESALGSYNLTIFLHLSLVFFGVFCRLICNIRVFYFMIISMLFLLFCIFFHFRGYSIFFLSSVSFFISFIRSVQLLVVLVNLYPTL